MNLLLSRKFNRLQCTKIENHENTAKTQCQRAETKTSAPIYVYKRSMIRENWQLLPMNRLSFRNNRSNFKTAGELQIILEEFIEEYTPI
jgi:hypothetical protein